MPSEVEMVVWFTDGAEPPDRGEMEAAIQERYPDAYITEWEEEEV